MSKIKFTEEQIQTIISKYNNGQSITSLSEELGYCRQTISNLLKREGIEIVNKQNVQNFL